VALLDGGAQAYPRMLSAIAHAQRTVHLEVYLFEAPGVGGEFIAAFSDAAARGVSVSVVIDGWGSARGGWRVAAVLREAGCSVLVYNRLRALLVGRFGRNHRKVLLVDDEIAFVGGINIGDDNLSLAPRRGWADLALEIRGPHCARLGHMVRREAYQPVDASVRIYLCGIGGGFRLRRRYIKAFASARTRIDLAHGYFLPDSGVVRAIVAAARRGVEVRLLLAGATDHPLARAASRSLYRPLLRAGVEIREWSGSVLHAKVATVDGRRLLVGSFNLDPFSLANSEALIEVDDPLVVVQAQGWIERHSADARLVSLAEADSWRQRWLGDPLGHAVARAARTLGLLMAGGRPGRVPPDPSRDRRSGVVADQSRAALPVLRASVASSIEAKGSCHQGDGV